jgi:hypothetical protein
MVHHWCQRPLWSTFPYINTDRGDTRARIFKPLRSPRIDSMEPIPPGCVAWRAGTKALFLLGSVPSPHILYQNSSTEVNVNDTGSNLPPIQHFAASVNDTFAVTTIRLLTF